MLNEKNSTRGQLFITRLLLACGIVGPLVFIIVFLIEGVTRPNYNAWYNVVSELSIGQQGWEQIGNFIVCGLSMLCFAVGLRQTLQSGQGFIMGPILIGLFGVTLIIVGLFVTDPSAGPQTLHGMIHNDVTPLVFFSVVATSFVLARRFEIDPNWKTWVPYSIATGILVTMFFIATNIAVLLDQHGTWPGAPVGLLQRIAIIIGWGWVSLIAWRFFKTR